MGKPAPVPAGADGDGRRTGAAALRRPPCANAPQPAGGHAQRHALKHALARAQPTAKPQTAQGKGSTATQSHPKSPARAALGP